MAKEEAKELVKAGLGPEAWLKMWNTGFIHDQPEPLHDHDHDETHATSCGDDDCTHEAGHVDGGHAHEQDGGVDAYLKRNLAHLTGDQTDKTVFVSLCGDSGDMEWLCDQGYEVVGAELSETAVKKVFNRKQGDAIPCDIAVEGDLKIYMATDGKKLKVYVGDFFLDAMSPERLGTFDCIWDAHGIVALPVNQHEAYAKKLAGFLKPGGKMLFSTVNYDESQLRSGPAPAPVPASRLREMYPEWEVKLLEEKGLTPGELDGVEKWSNHVVLVTSKS